MAKLSVSVWEERSKRLGNTPKSVLEQAYPDVVREYLHALHMAEVLHLIHPNDHLALDVGCGYGRIAQEVVRHRHICVRGIDLSASFVKHFNRQLKGHGRARVGTMCSLPYRSDSFDCIWVVTSFMYLQRTSDKRRAVRELFRVLKPGGRLLFIESNALGVALVTLWGLIPYIYRHVLAVKKVETGGYPLSWGEIEALTLPYGRVRRKVGYPLSTLSLLPCVLLGFIVPKVIRRFYAIARRIDTFVAVARFSYIVVYELEKS